MLSTSAPIQSDLAVPALSACLDAPTVLDAARCGLLRMPAARREQWREARLIEALYHPGRYVRVVYAMLCDPSTPTSRAWPVEELVSLFAPVRSPMSRRGEILRIEGHDVEAYGFPNDRRLRGLRTFGRRDLTLATWRRWSPPDARIDEDSLQRKLVRYVPEQKCVVRLRAEWTQADGVAKTQRIAVRCASTPACEALDHRHRWVAAHIERSGPGIAVPRVVGCDAKLGLLAVEWLRGETLIEALRSGTVSNVMDQAAQALQQFHAIPAPGLMERTNSDLADGMREALSDLALVCPHLDQAIAELHRELPGRLSKTSPGPVVTLHNDLHPDQLTFKRNRVALLDLERMAMGGEDIDVVNLATQLEMLGCRPDRDVDAATASNWRRAFLASWRQSSRRPLDPVRFHLLAARTRLELARGMMRHLRPWWMPFAEECVTRASIDLQRAVASEEIP